MTATTTRPAIGHPVRSFVLFLIAVGLVLLALVVTGFVHPDITSPGSGAQDLGDGAQTFSVAVENGSVLPVDVLEVRWPTSNTASAEIGIAPSTRTPDGQEVISSYDLEPIQPFTLDGGATAWLAIRVVPECDARIGSPSLLVETASGIRRTMDLGHPAEDVQGGCP